MPRGGRRPGAGAPKGNLNALKTGRYSKRLTALRAALEAMPKTAGLLARTTARDRRKMELLAYGLQSYAEILLFIARGGSIGDLSEPRLRNQTISNCQGVRRGVECYPRRSSYLPPVTPPDCASRSSRCICHCSASRRRSGVSASSS